MCFQKIKEFLKNKKVQVIAGTVAGALVLTLSGAMILNNNIENKNVLVGKNVEKESKVEDKKDEESNEEKVTKEELKNIETSNLSDGEKKELEDKRVEVESKIENKEVSSETSNSTQSSTSNKNDNKVQSNSTSSNKIEASNTNSNKVEAGNTSSNKNEHTHNHNWVAINSSVHHAEEGHYENILVKEAWTEEIPVYEDQVRSICNTCGEDITGNTSAHIKEHMLAGNDNGGFRTEVKRVQTGTNKITHDAVYEKKWVVDKAAWDETVITGYKCNECGATK